MSRHFQSACACFCPRAAVRGWSRATTAHGRLSAQPSSLSKTVGSCLRPRVSTIRLPKRRFVSVSSSRRSSAARSRRAISTCSTTACRRPSRRSKSAASWWWRSVAPGVAAASRPHCLRQAARRRSRLPMASSRRSRRLSAPVWTLKATWCWSTASPAPAKPRFTFRRLSACWPPAVRHAFWCPRSH